jgi:hypothetical protein
MSAIRSGAAGAIAAAAMLLTGCGSAVRGYRLSHQDGTEILIPPGMMVGAQQTLDVRLPRARKAPFQHTDCGINRGPVAIRWQGGTAYVRVKSGSDLLGFGQGNVNGQQIVLDPLQYVDEFRKDLIALESSGCLHMGEGQTLAASIAEKLPFPPFIAYLLRFGAFDLDQFIDLTPDFRLRVVYPIYSAANSSDTKEITGVATAYYEIVSNQKDGRVRISPTIGKDSPPNGSQAPKSAKQIATQFPNSFAYFRLILKKGISSKDPVTLAIVLSSGDRKHLEEATQELNNATEPSCKAIASADADCTMFPALTGVNAEIRVKLNGKEAFARLGAQVNELIRDVGTDDIPSSVHVRRMYSKGLVPITTDSGDRDILALILMPGDVVNYR